MVEISVIIPVYNVEKYLPETLDNLCAQSFADAEFILVNDGSKDNSLKILEEYAAKDSRIKVITQQNGGPAKARNTGMDAATGNYIVFMDSDDLLAEEALAKMYDMIQGYDILVHGTDFIGDYDTVPAWIRNAGDITPMTLDNFSIGDAFTYNGCGPVLWLHMIKAEIIQKEHLRIDEGLFIGEDFSFAVAYFARAKKVKFVADKFYKYRLFRTGSLMTTYQDRPREKIEQSIDMMLAMYRSIKDYIKPSDELAILKAILIFNFRDFYRLDPEDQKHYSGIILEHFEHLHTDEHVNELPGMIMMMYGYLMGAYDGTVQLKSINNEKTAQEYWNMFTK